MAKKKNFYPTPGPSPQRGGEFSEGAPQRDGEFSEGTPQRGGESSEGARQKGGEFSEGARQKGGEFSEGARQRGGESQEGAPQRGDNAHKPNWRERYATMAEIEQFLSDHLYLRRNALQRDARLPCGREDRRRDSV